MPQSRYLRRKEAAAYVRAKYAFGTEKTFAKLAVVGGGPEMVYVGRVPLYTEEKLDAWAQSKISLPVRSTSERKLGCAQKKSAEQQSNAEAV